MKVDSAALASEIASIVRDAIDDFGKSLDGPVIDFVAQSIHDSVGAQAQYVVTGIGKHDWDDCPYREQYISDAYAATDAVLNLLMVVFSEIEE